MKELETMKIWDISPTISESIAVWPGDTPVSRKVLCDISQGSNIDLSTITSTVHLGAHADSPRHYHRSGITAEAMDLSRYIGPCYVHTVFGKKMITAEDCAIPLKSGAKRILFKTNTFPNPDFFNNDFAAFEASAVEILGQSGVILIGIDTPSIDPFSSNDLPSHQKLYQFRMSNLEGLVLNDVVDGEYELIALPLKLKGYDASPVRAILRR